MRCLVIGGDGMLGHQLLLSWQSWCDVRVTLRKSLREYASYGIFNQRNTIPDVDIRDLGRLRQVFREFRPDAVINAAGVIKQRDAAHQHLPCIEINSLFPHQLRQICEEASARLIHISTDCVFNGKRGRYTERDVADAEDLYGRSKLLGEVAEAPALTLRTSIIGLELKNHQSLIDWFLHQSGTIRGFTRAIYTGVTTQEIARVIREVLLHHPRLTGLYQLASEPINKCDLLTRLSAKLGRQDLRIIPDDSFFCDRSLVGELFTAATGIQVASWDEMLDDLARQILTRKGKQHAA